MNPKYQIVAEALRAGIRDGTYQKTLPTEQLLCAQFQVSRQTVRQALSLLESERLIDRRQRLPRPRRTRWALPSISLMTTS